MDLKEEKKIVERAKKDPEAFGILYDAHYSKIFGYVLKRVANVDIAQDIVSESFLKAMKNIWKFRWQNVSFSAWLYRIASNEIANFFRKKKPTVSIDLVLEPVSSSDPRGEVILAEAELKKHKDLLDLQEQIVKISMKYQEVITLRFFDKKQIKEISEILGKKEGTIKSLLHRGIKELAKLMPPEKD